MGFTKLDDGLDGSSIFREDDAVFKVWMLILSKTRRNGVAPISADYIASITRKSDVEVERCLVILESPDPRSRTTSQKGRRIRRVNGGFFVVNYRQYRQRAETEEIREYERERKRKQREVKCPGHVPDKPGHSASASPSVSGEEKGSGGGGAEFYRRSPANPLLVGRRVELESECLALVREVAGLTGDDPVEVIAQASGYKGAATTKLNPATMSDDRLANTVRDLRADLVELRKQKGVAHDQANH